MRADDLRKVLKNICNLPYKTILVDGDWGIGKSYEVEHSLGNQDHVFAVSLFGLHESQDIYHELLSAAEKWKDKLKVIGKLINAGRAAMKETEAGAAMNKALETFITEKDVLIKTLCEQNRAIVVIDDLERIGENIQIQEVLGIVEEIRKRTPAKIILIANVKEMEQGNKEIFDRFCEKIIDRKFLITEPASDIQWDTLGIDEEFILNFLNKHKVKNLRTLQKAENFFGDVITFAGKLEDQEFRTELQKICFAIVVEDVEKLYFGKCQEHKNDSNIQKTLKQLNQKFLNRVKSYYLVGLKSADDLIKIIYQHYNNEVIITSKEIEEQYYIFKRSDEKPNFYKSEEEIRLLLPELVHDVNQTNILGDFIRKAQSYLVWAKILDEDRTPIYDLIRSKAKQFMQEGIENGKILSYGEYGLLEIDLPEMKRIYKEEYEKGCKKYVENVIEKILQSIDEKDFKDGFEMSRILREMGNNTNYRAHLKEMVPALLTIKILPVGSITEEQYYISYILLRILFEFDRDKYEAFLESNMESMDCVSRYRVNHIKEEIEKNE